jgi:hypothetical protein
MSRTLLLLTFCLALTAPAARAGDLAGRAAALEDTFLESSPSLGLQQVYNLMSMPQRIALAGKLKELVVARVPPGAENHPALGQLPPAMREMIKQLVVLAHTASPEEVEKVIAAQDLDHFAPIPTPLLRLYHEHVMSGATPSGKTRRELLAADVADPAWKSALAATSGFILPEEGPAEVRLLAKGDAVPDAELPKDSLEPALNGALVVQHKVAKWAPHALANSARLARALNLLMRPKSAGPVVLKIGEKSFAVDTAAALVETLAEHGPYEIAVFDARMFVNFLDYSVKKFGVTRSIRIPTWAATALPTAPGKSLLVPVCHTEHVIVLYRKGKKEPEALVRWFLAMPDDVSQGTLFRPAVWSRRSWSGYRIVRGYEGAQAAGRLLAVAQRVMSAFNFLQDKYRFPGRAYGVLGVCNDTTGILEAALQGSAEKTTAWPMVRDPRFDMYLAEALDGLGFPTRPAGDLTVLQVPCDSRPDLFPEVNDLGRMMLRIGANIPQRDLSAMHFKDLAETLDAMKLKHPELEKGLSLTVE